jgi:hypothetical protein
MGRRHFINGRGDPYFRVIILEFDFKLTIDAPFETGTALYCNGVQERLKSRRSYELLFPRVSKSQRSTMSPL